ncbi:MAG TPA: imidazoleglycerol-phosphate dehydratase HisB [Syntrophomonadaceae bacterium]|nr:imidazoleglycerol-phosphate dehydratase HisB [Syntrophomonadaceae bacterium]
MGRVSEVERITGETRVKVRLDLDGKGSFQGATGIGFLDHMLHLWARHGLFDLNVEAEGDLQVDAHHTVEDIGICLGEALRRALGDKEGINRYGSVLLPMDEALVMIAVDISGRPYLVYDVQAEGWRVGDLPVELVPEFFRAFVNNAGLTLHLRLISGRNTHHIVEALFKGCARALRQAVAGNDRESGVPSTKGIL